MKLVFQKKNNLATTILEHHYFKIYTHIYILSIKLYPKWKQAKVSVFSTSANYSGFKKNLLFFGKRIIQIKTIKGEN